MRRLVVLTVLVAAGALSMGVAARAADERRYSDRESEGQPLHRDRRPAGRRHRREHDRVHRRQRRRAHRRQIRRLRQGHPRPGEVGDGQAGHDDHQHALPRRPHRRQPATFRAASSSSPTRTRRRTWCGWRSSRARTPRSCPRRRSRTRMSLFSGKDRIDLRYFGAGHTNGDAVIVFPALRTVVMGDLFARKWAPFADADERRQHDGVSADACEGDRRRSRMWTRSSPATPPRRSDPVPRVSFVRSNPVMKWSDLQEFADFTREFVAAAQAAEEGRQERGRRGEEPEPAGEVQGLQHGPGRRRRAARLRGVEVDG